MTYQLEEPFFEDKGKITAQKEIGENKTQMTYSSNETIKGNIEVTNSGDLANYTFLQVGKTTTKDGKPVLHGVGSAVWSTDSTGKLAFLDNMLSFFIIEIDEMGNFSSKDRELK
jgi:hypothetical protein